MAIHETSIPPMKVWVRREFLYNEQKGHGEWDRAVLVSVRCIPGQVMLFQALLENGVLRDKLPCHAFAWKQTVSSRPFHHLQLWNAFSANFSVVEIQYLSGLAVDVKMKDGTWERGHYLWTIQWGSDNAVLDLTLAEDPSEHKSAHFIALDSGEFAFQPNNRLRWYEPSFVTKEFPARPDYVVNSGEWNSETYSKWQTSDDDRWAYDIEEK